MPGFVPGVFKTVATGDGINNAGVTVDFARRTVRNSRATHDGSGILIQGSGACTLAECPTRVPA